MESGKHQVSLKMTGGGEDPLHFSGLVRDGKAPCENCDVQGNADVCNWSHGNEGYDNEGAGDIKEGQIVSMEADLDKGTLKFWVDGKQHGPGRRSGVTGRLHWAVSLYHSGAAALIVPTPELQPLSVS
jgi:hypothetical protein